MKIRSLLSAALPATVLVAAFDGTVQVVKAGEAVTVAKEWAGIWETEAYTRIRVIYSGGGSAFE